MNLEAERIRLIDISSEDDFLIDSQSDNSAFDLRLSVAYETQNELVCSLARTKLTGRPGMNDAVPLFAAKEQETDRPGRENCDNECSLRKSLAWDHAFFTSPGFLELEELSLVNRGFKNPEVPLLHENQQKLRSKVFQERNSSHGPGIGAGGRQKTQSFMKQKLASPNKMTPVRDPKVQLVNTKRSVTTSRVVQRSHTLQSPTEPTENGEFLKSIRKISQTGISKLHTKKPPLKAVSKNGEGAGIRMMVSRRSNSWSDNSASSSQPLVSSVDTNNSFDFSSSSSCMSDARLVNLWRSQDMEGEHLLRSSSPTSGESRNTDDIEARRQDSPCKGLTSDVSTSQGSALEGHRDNQQHHRSPIEQGSLGKGLLRQNATSKTKRSPLSAGVHRSSKPSSLRLPSQKIGFFEMLCPEAQTTSTEGRPKNACRSMHATEHEPKRRIKDLKPKEVPQAPLKKKGSHIEIVLGSHDEDDIKPSGKGHRRTNQYHFEKQAKFPGIEEKENMFVPEGTVIELELNKSSPSPSKLGTNGSLRSNQCSSSSGKRLLKAQRPMRQTTLSPAGNRIPFSTKGSPLKRSAFF